MAQAYRRSCEQSWTPSGAAPAHSSNNNISTIFILPKNTPLPQECTPHIRRIATFSELGGSGPDRRSLEESACVILTTVPNGKCCDDPSFTEKLSGLSGSHRAWTNRGRTPSERSGPQPELLTQMLPSCSRGWGGGTRSLVGDKNPPSLHAAQGQGMG